MSISLIKPYFTQQLNTLGLTEWTDAFGEDNLPSTVVDRSYHQRVVTVSGTSINQETLEYLVNHELKIYFKSFNDTDLGVDNALIESESVIVKCCNLPDYSTAGLKGVFLDSMDVSPFDNEVNDNLMVATIQFSVRIFKCLY